MGKVFEIRYQLNSHRVALVEAETVGEAIKLFNKGEKIVEDYEGDSEIVRIWDVEELES